jgi:hypothetical protein
MPNEGRYMPLELEHLLKDEARRKGVDFEKLKYDYETDDFQKLIDAAIAEDAARSAAEAALTKAEAEAAAAKVDFVAAHCEKMFAAAINQRSNCVKFRLFSVLQNACERIALYDDDEFSSPNKLCKLIARAENWLLDEPDAERFHRAISFAFERSAFKDFPKLADALKMEIEMDDIRRLASKFAPRRQVRLDDEAVALMKRRAPMRRNPKIRIPELPPFPK